MKSQPTLRQTRNLTPRKPFSTPQISPNAKSKLSHLLLACASLFIVTQPPARAAEPFATHRLSVGPSIGFLNWSLGMGGTLTYTYRKDPGSRFHFGAESGFLHWDASTDNPAEITALPILGTATYLFNPGARIKAYVGASVGIAPTWLGGGTIEFDTMALLRPGLEFKYFYFEPRVGLYDFNFVILPTVGVYIDLL